MSKRKKQKQRRQRHKKHQRAQMKAPAGERAAPSASGAKAPTPPAETVVTRPPAAGGKSGKKVLLPLQWVWRVEDLARIGLSAEGKLDLEKVRKDPAMRVWLERQRCRYLAGRLDPLKAADLEKLGMDWKTPVDRGVWDERVDELKKGALSVDGRIDPEKVEKNVRLKRWLNRQRVLRQRGKLSAERVAELERMGMEWAVPVRLPGPWLRRLEELKGAALSPTGKIDEGRLHQRPRLRAWLERQRARRNAGKLSEEQERELERVGIDWDTPYRRPSAWDVRLEQLRREGLSPAGRIDLEKVRQDRALRVWLETQRLRNQRGSLPPERFEALNRLGLDWESPVVLRKPRRSRAEAVQQAWERRLEALRDELEESEVRGWEQFNNLKLRDWLRAQRSRFRRGLLSGEQKEKLDAVVPFDWTAHAPHRFRKLAGTKWEETRREYAELVRKAGGPPPRTELPRRLRIWLNQQRTHYRQGKLPPRKIRRLEEAGVEWELPDSGISPSWWQHYDRLAALFRERGRAEPSHQAAEGQKLAKWLTEQRARWRAGRLQPVQVEALQRVGLSAEPQETESWRRSHKELKKLCETRFGGRIPPGGRLPNELDHWLGRQRLRRRRGLMPRWQIEALDALGMQWERPPPVTRGWWKSYARLKKFHEEHGHTLVSPRADRSLASWVQSQRRRGRRGQLSEEQVKALREVGLEFDVTDQPRAEWMDHYVELEEFRRTHGHSRVPRQYPPNQSLADWVAVQKQRHRRRGLPPAHKALLDRLEFPWVKKPRPKARAWMETYGSLEAYYREHGHSRVPHSHDRFLGLWVAAQRVRRKRGTLTPEQIALLDKLDFVWEARPKRPSRKARVERR